MIKIIAMTVGMNSNSQIFIVQIQCSSKQQLSQSYSGKTG